MQTKPQHTATPWGYTYDGSSEWSIGPAEDPQSNPIMTIWSKNDDKARANATFIVRAVNCHEELVDLLHEAANLIAQIKIAGANYPLVKRISEAIAKASEAL